MKIQGKRVLLTGAAGGIGQAIARRLASEGAEMVLTGRNEQTLAALGKDLNARIIACDLLKPDDVRRLVDEAGSVDILVANAGLPGTAPLTRFSFNAIGRVLDVNLQAPILLANALIEPMRARGGGHMVFISSMAGKVASPLSSLYSASKYGLRGFAQCLRLELHDDRIGVSCIFPGIIREAGMFVNSGATPPPGVGTNSPDEVARAVLRAIEDNVAEIDVAPATVKMWSALATLAPGFTGWIQRKVGADKFVEQYTRGNQMKK